MEPIGIFILATICQFYSCAQNVSDSVERMQYASVAGEEYLEGEKIDTNLDDKVYFISINLLLMQMIKICSSNTFLQLEKRRLLDWKAIAMKEEPENIT